MHCPNCGNELPENAAFCAKCGTPAPQVEAPVAEVVEEAQVVETKPSFITTLLQLLTSNTKIFFGVIGGALALIILIIVLLCCGGKSYKEPVEKYLDFIASKSTDADDYVTEACFGGDFGRFLFSDDAEDANYTTLNTSFNEEFDDEDFEYDNWKDYVEEEMIPITYRNFAGIYGEWKLDYDISECEKLSNRKIRDLQDDFKDIVENYEEMLEDYDFNADEEEIVEDFIKDIYRERITEAYSVEAEVTIESAEKGFCDEEYKFIVAKVAGEWVILDGPSFSNFLYMED